MEDFAYLSYDAATKKTSLTDEFVGQMVEAFEGLRNMRREYLEASDEAMATQKSYDDAKAEAISAGVVGNNAETRAANLDLTLRPLHDNLVKAKTAQRHAEHSMQSCLDAVRMFESILEAVKVGVVPVFPPGTQPSDLINAGLKGFGLS